MSDYLFLVPVSLAMGLVGLLAFLWTLRKDQYEDLDGAAYRVLDNDDFPLPDTHSEKATTSNSHDD